jgi:hypothetical protein
MFFELVLSNEPFYIFFGSDSIHGSSDSFFFANRLGLARVLKFETRPATTSKRRSPSFESSNQGQHSKLTVFSFEIRLYRHMSLTTNHYYILDDYYSTL